SEDQLLKQIDYQTPPNIKNTYQIPLKLKTLPIQQTNTFFQLFKIPQQKHPFKFPQHPYFLHIQKTYQHHPMLKLPYIHLQHYLHTFQTKHQNLNQQL
uniref:peptidoglycan bridge formation glycyltransferase FemA/FemB family protein n=1 Tax=Staphylococcus epidermidis TaxID=1282 RepID=UPI0011A3762F